MLRPVACQRVPDPRRYFKNAGTLGEISIIIGQALGAFASAFGGVENFAQQKTEAALDRDMRAQEEEIRLGQVSDSNLLARLNDQLGDLEQAKSAWKLTQGELLDREIKSFA